jgi:hypothetical protein
LEYKNIRLIFVMSFINNQKVGDRISEQKRL